MTRPVPPSKKSKKAGGIKMSLTPSDDSTQALFQLSRQLGSAWLEYQDNPAVKLVACESTVAARVNSYGDGKWVQRRVGDDTVVALVELKDGTREKRSFMRTVLDGGWKRAPSA